MQPPAQLGERTRSKAERLTRIPGLLKAREYSVAELAELFGVSVKTAKRDLDVVMEQHTVEQPTYGRYRITHDPQSLNAAEALTIFSAVRLLHHHSGRRNIHYQAALAKLMAMLPASLRDSVSWEQHAPPNNSESAVFETLALALAQNRWVKFEYLASTTTQGWEQRELGLDGIEVSPDNLALYAIGFERLKSRARRVLKVSRMRRATLLADEYHPQPLPHQAARIWGITALAGGDSLQVRARFHPSARYRFDEGGFQGVQITGTEASGHFTVTLDVCASFPREALPWLRSWGAQVEVLAPLDFREMWQDDIRQLWVLSGLPTAGLT